MEIGHIWIPGWNFYFAEHSSVDKSVAKHVLRGGINIFNHDGSLGIWQKAIGPLEENGLQYDLFNLHITLPEITFSFICILLNNKQK